MSVSYDKEQHDRAKAEGQYLITIAIEGKYLKRASMSVQGPAGEQEAEILRKAWADVLAVRNKKAGKASAKKASGK